MTLYFIVDCFDRSSHVETATKCKVQDRSRELNFGTEEESAHITVVEEDCGYSSLQSGYGRYFLTIWKFSLQQFLLKVSGTTFSLSPGGQKSQVVLNAYAGLKCSKTPLELQCSWNGIDENR